MSKELKKTEDEWKKILGPRKFCVLRKGATEAPFTGKYNKYKENGVYVCAGCGNKLFSSKDKFDSKSGWPSFSNTISKNSTRNRIDKVYNMKRVEIICSKCGSHLGHVFKDGPKPTGKRYCINSVALDFKKK